MPLDIVMADPKAFDGRSRLEGPAGGTEVAFCELAEALAALGHRVQAFTAGARRLCHEGVTWRPLADRVPERCDLLIANRGSKMIGLAPRAHRRVFWLHNPAQHISKPKFVVPLLRWRPTIVVLSNYHRTTLPTWIPKRKVSIIPHGVTAIFQRAVPRTEPPRPRAIMTSHPERGLLELVEIWVAEVFPRVPNAELLVFSGTASATGHRAEAVDGMLERAQSVAGPTVRFHAPVAQDQLAKHLRDARLMPYIGDPNIGETYCLAVAEAQTMGVPVVTKPVGSLPERLRDGVTGFVRSDDDAFADACVALLTDDALWRHQHIAAVESAGDWTWRHAAEAFADLCTPGGSAS